MTKIKQWYSIQSVGGTQYSMPYYPYSSLKLRHACQFRPLVSPQTQKPFLISMSKTFILHDVRLHRATSHSPAAGMILQIRWSHTYSVDNFGRYQGTDHHSITIVDNVAADRPISCTSVNYPQSKFGLIRSDKEWTSIQPVQGQRQAEVVRAEAIRLVASQTSQQCTSSASATNQTVREQMNVNGLTK